MKKSLHPVLLLAVFFLFTQAAQAQPKKFKIDGRKCMLVEITDPGEFYSTYNFEDADIELMKIDKMQPVLIQKIQDNHTEKSWPNLLSALDQRTANPDKIKSYVVYKVIQFNDKCVLVAPAKYNAGLGDGWAPAHDIFFVVGVSGIKQ